jgi:hypothetical protein
MYFAITSRITGAILLGAAGLKLAGVQASAVANSGLLPSAGLRLGLIEAEVLLGSALVIGIFPRTIRRVAALVFLIFAVVSFRAAWVGEASCGCCGRLTISPWWVFAVDVVIVVGLIGISPSPTSDSSSRAAGWRWMRIAATVLLLVNGVVAAYGIRAGSLSGGLARLRGEQLAVSPPILDFGAIAGGQVVESKITIANLS